MATESPPAAATPTSGEPPSLLASVGALLRELPGLVSDRVELLSLELRRAGMALAQIVALVVAAAILGVTAWLALWSAVAAVLVVNAGLHWGVALLIVMAINLLAISLALLRIRSLIPVIGLPATKRHLTVSASTRPANAEALVQASQ